MLFFLDESGTDHGMAPYEVLSAIAVRESAVWNLIQGIDLLEKEHFGINLHAVGSEIKAKKLLTVRRFHLAQQCTLMPTGMRRDLTRMLLQNGWIANQTKQNPAPTSEQLAAYGQSSIAFVHSLMALCKRCDVKAFAAIVKKDAPRKKGAEFLRKDYRYLLHRFASYLSEISASEVGILVFDEIERKQSRRLLNQFETFCKET